MRIRIISILLGLLLCLPSASSSATAMCDPKTSRSSCVNLACSAFGETTLDGDHASIVACLPVAADANAQDCTNGCLWANLNAGSLVRVSIELIGAGGGGGGSDSSYNGYGGGGADGRYLQFDAYVHKGALLTISPGGGGGPGYNQGAGATPFNGGGGLYARGGSGGAAGVTPGSGAGGGGGAASVVQGDGLFAVAGGGGGGGGGSYGATGFGGNQDAGIVSIQKMIPVFDGAPGYSGCLSGISKTPLPTFSGQPSDAYGMLDGAGGGGGGGGYPAGTGGAWGCDAFNGVAGYSASGGMDGTNYVSSGQAIAAFSHASNSAGVGAGGPGGSGNVGTQGGQGQCGRVTIWSSTGAKYQFDCNSSAPSWIVQ